MKVNIIYDKMLAFGINIREELHSQQMKEKNYSQDESLQGATTGASVVMVTCSVWVLSLYRFEYMLSLCGFFFCRQEQATLNS